MSGPASSKSRQIAILVGAGILVLASVLALYNTAIRPAPNAFWETLRIEGREVNTYDTLEDMLTASDAVVIARVVGVDVGRAIQGDAPEDVVTYARIDISVEAVVSGDAPRLVPVEFLVGATPEKAASDVRTLRESMPTGLAIYFLHEKQGTGEEGLYRVTSSTGLWAETPRSPLDAPLQRESPSSSGLYADEMNGIQSIEELARLLVGYAAR